MGSIFFRLSLLVLASLAALASLTMSSWNEAAATLATAVVLGLIAAVGTTNGRPSMHRIPANSFVRRTRPRPYR